MAINYVSGHKQSFMCILLKSICLCQATSNHHWREVRQGRGLSAFRKSALWLSRAGFSFFDASPWFPTPFKVESCQVEVRISSPIFTALFWSETAKLDYTATETPLFCSFVFSSPPSPTCQGTLSTWWRLSRCSRTSRGSPHHLFSDGDLVHEHPAAHLVVVPLQACLAARTGCHVDHLSSAGDICVLPDWNTLKF